MEVRLYFIHNILRCSPGNMAKSKGKYCMYEILLSLSIKGIVRTLKPFLAKSIPMGNLFVFTCFYSVNFQN